MMTRSPDSTAHPTAFIAARIRSQTVREELEFTQEQLRQLLPARNPLPERDPHITLRYLGPLPDQFDSSHLAAHLTTLVRTHSPIHLALGPLQSFPGVLWVSLQGPATSLTALHNLARHVDELTDGHTWPTPRIYPFIPHITVITFLPPNEAPRLEDIEQILRPAPIPFRIDSIELLESSPSRDNPSRYSPLAPPFSLGESGR